MLPNRFAEQDVIKREVGVLRQLVKSGAGGGNGSDRDDARSIRIIVPHELDRVDEENGDRIARQEQQQEQQRKPWPDKDKRIRRVGLLS
jgi:hypothetical protein